MKISSQPGLGSGEPGSCKQRIALLEKSRIYPLAGSDNPPNQAGYFQNHREKFETARFLKS
jgi:hypothetical protein